MSLRLVIAFFVVLTARDADASERGVGARFASDPFDGGSHATAGVVGSWSALSVDRRAAAGVIGVAGVLWRPGFEQSYLFAETGLTANFLAVGSSVTRLGVSCDVAMIHVLGVGAFLVGTASVQLVAQWRLSTEMLVRVGAGPRFRAFFATGDNGYLGGVATAMIAWQ